ncbi:MAG: hypothetical protein ACLP1D_12575 [Xanthobacteraceae bacterium]|jgi:hypothetical protein
MLKFVARRMLRQFRTHYNYDTSYMETMLREAPAAFFKFAKLMSIARYREVVPVEACFAAKLVGALKEDCGPCTQLVVDMAREAGVADDQIEAVLSAAPAAMTTATALGYHFARAVADRTADDDVCRDAVRGQWGEKGVIELTLALQVGRIFPMVKAGLGHAMACRRVVIGGRPVDVHHGAVAHAA